MEGKRVGALAVGKVVDMAHVRTVGLDGIHTRAVGDAVLALIDQGGERGYRIVEAV